MGLFKGLLEVAEAGDPGFSLVFWASGPEPSSISFLTIQRLNFFGARVWERRVFRELSRPAGSKAAVSLRETSLCDYR